MPIAPTQEAMLLDESQELQATAMHPPGCPEEASEPKGAARLGEIAVDPPGHAKAANTTVTRF